jgi:hypothetical protein
MVACPYMALRTIYLVVDKNICLVDVVFSCKKSMDFEPWVAHVHEMNTFLETSPTYFGSFYPMSILGSLDPFYFFF